MKGSGECVVSCKKCGALNWTGMKWSLTKNCWVAQSVTCGNCGESTGDGVG